MHLPPHLFGELPKTELGLDLLKKSRRFEDLFHIATNPLIPGLERRAAIMAMVVQNQSNYLFFQAQTGSSRLGFSLFDSTGALPVLINMIETAPDLSLRGYTCK